MQWKLSLHIFFFVNFSVLQVFCCSVKSNSHYWLSGYLPQQSSSFRSVIVAVLSIRCLKSCKSVQVWAVETSCMQFGYALLCYSHLYSVTFITFKGKLGNMTEESGKTWLDVYIIAVALLDWATVRYKFYNSCWKIGFLKYWLWPDLSWKERAYHAAHLSLSGTDLELNFRQGCINF